MRLTEVNTPALQRTFLDMVTRIYQGDTQYVRPLDQDIERVFDKEKNKFFRHGRAIRWVLFNDKNECIGRVAAFINDRTIKAKGNDQPTGGMGFFECIDDQAAANVLFQACVDWHKGHGIEAMDGPINFGERDAWWGLLAEGFVQPTYQMNYNPQYYVRLYETFGFGIFYKQLVFQRNLMGAVPEKMEEKYRRLMESPGFSFCHLDKKQIDKFTADFRTIYNEAWGKHAGFKEMSEAQAKAIMKILKPILVDWLIWFGYHNDRPVAFFFMIPDLNPIIKSFNGKFGLLQKLKVWWRINMTRKHTRCYGVLFGVVPEYQGRGLDGAIVKAASTVVHPKNQYNHMEMNWIGDFNPKMVRICIDVGGELFKTYYTMRYLFDRSIEFKRLPIIE